MVVEDADVEVDRVAEAELGKKVALALAAEDEAALPLPLLLLLLLLLPLKRPEDDVTAMVVLEPDVAADEDELVD